MKLHEILNERISPSQLKDVEKFADSLWGKLGIDVKFTKHFLDRVNDERNGKQISSAELIRLFKKEFEVHGKAIKNLDLNDEAVMKDLITSLNLPFVIKSDELIAKTVMRKPNFKTTNPEFTVK